MKYNLYLALKSARFFFCMPSVDVIWCYPYTVWVTCWMAFDVEISALCSWGSTLQMKVLSQQFNCLSYIFYDHTNTAEKVNEAGKQLFTWKGRAMVTFIPPTQAALQNERAVGWSCLGTDAPNLPSLNYILISSNYTNINLLYKLHIKSTCTLLVRIDI